MNQQAEYTFHYFSADNKPVLEEVAAALSNSTSVNKRIIDPALPTGMTFQLLDFHKEEYGTGLGYIQNDQGQVIAFGGLHYVHDVELYEVVCFAIPGQEAVAADALELLVYEAFAVLGMDKVCARAIPGTVEDKCYGKHGFEYIGERAFAEDSMEQIWNYYELENHGNMISAERSGHTDAEWDNIF